MWRAWIQIRSNLQGKTPCPACLSWKISHETVFQFPSHCNSISSLPEQIRRPKSNAISNRSQAHFHIQFSTLLLIFWIYLKFLSVCRVPFYPWFFLWEAVVPLIWKQCLSLQGSLSVDVLKLLFAGPVCWMDSLPSCPGHGRGGSCPWALPAVLEQETHSWRDRSSSSSWCLFLTVKMRADPLVVWGAEQAPCPPSGPTHLAVNPPHMLPSAPASSRPAGVQDGAIFPALSMAIWHRPWRHSSRFGLHTTLQAWSPAWLAQPQYKPVFRRRKTNKKTP